MNQPNAVVEPSAAHEANHQGDKQRKRPPGRGYNSGVEGRLMTPPPIAFTLWQFEFRGREATAVSFLEKGFQSHGNNDVSW
ncbi:hypothetical protein TSUD_292520 [Trifolium subterraneum]|uniref:Uncharacterized protein n=1 Tax=Trifolium subterraneum TaxID=3900 RepID=A0A2Z6NPU1_TRISU|nr:hypothetical protein TSUD_292520 [Trifolium subterraneum]